MKAYKVTYEIEVDALSPTHAALLVEKVLRKPEFRPYLTIVDTEGNVTNIDLEAHEPNVFRKGERQPTIIELMFAS